mmetsp:Transcript_28356/g.67216  ORF Transcript_28356/g.67216 Transcript_28356/m.67216 type:complete len:902 (+) Transcript_28356:59-2764(+)
MNVVKNLKAKVQGFCKNLTFKKKQLIIATLLIFLNCTSWKKVNAAPFMGIPEVEIENTGVNKLKKKIMGAKGKNLNQWGLSSDNFFLATDTVEKAIEQTIEKTYDGDFSEDLSDQYKWYHGCLERLYPFDFFGKYQRFTSTKSFCFDEKMANTPFICYNTTKPSLPDLIEKLNEAEKLRKKTNQGNFGSMILSGLKVFDSKYSFFSDFSELLLKPKFSSLLESLELAAMSNPDLQSFSSCLFLYPEIKSFHGLDNFINEDPGKGFVLGKISSDSGSDLSREIIIQQKIFGFNTIKNLKNAFHYQKKISSSLFRKDVDCIARNKTQDFGKWAYSHTKKHPSFPFFDISSEKKKVLKTTKKKMILFPNIGLDKLESLDSKFSGNLSLDTDEESFFSQKNQPAEDFKMFTRSIWDQLELESIFMEHLSPIGAYWKQGEKEIPRFQCETPHWVYFNEFYKKLNLFKYDSLAPSMEEDSNDVHLGFCDEFVLTPPEIELNWNIKERIFPFHLHNLGKTIKKFIVSKQLKIQKPLDLPKENKKKSSILFIKGTNENNLNCFRKNFFDEIFKGKKFIPPPKDARKIPDSEISHLKESLKLNDRTGIEFLGKIFSIGSKLPKSFSQSIKFFYQASFVGNLDAQHFLGSSLLEGGDGVARNKNISRSIMISSAKLSHMDSIYDSSLLIENGLGGETDVIRAFYLNKQITDYGGEDDQISGLIPIKEKVGLNPIFFFALKKEESGLLSCFVGSLFFNSMSFFSGAILEKVNKISSALNYQNKAFFENSFNSILSVIELFFENRQTFLSIEKSKLSNGLLSKLKTLKGSTSGQGFSIPIYTILKLRSLRPNYLELTLFFFSISRVILLSFFQIRVNFSRFSRLITEIITGEKNIRFLKLWLKIFLTLRVIFF